MSNLSALDKLDIAENIQSLLDKLESDISPLEKLDIADEVELLLERLLEGDVVTADTVDINDQAAVDAFVLAEIERLGDDFDHADYTSALTLVSPYIRAEIREPIDSDGTKKAFDSLALSGIEAMPDGLDEMLSTDSSESLKKHLADARRDILNAFYTDDALKTKLEEFSVSVSGKLVAAKEELDAVSAAIRKEKPKDAQGYNLSYWTKEYGEWEEKYKKATKPLKTRWTKAQNEWLALIDEWKQEQVKAKLDEIDALSEALFKPGKAVIDAVMSKSPITTEQADAYANQQVIDSNAKTSLNNIGYTEEKLRADIAEFYRITGGKVAPLRIRQGSYGSGRASAMDNGDNALDTIQIGNGFTKKTLWHEMGHSVEFGDSTAKIAAHGFLKKRRESGKLFKLRDLTGQGYRKDEVAYKDNFFDPYVGKYYKDGYTEVMSMGFECLSSPEKAAILASKDKEHLALVMGYMTGDMRQLPKLRLRKANNAKSNVIEAAKTREELSDGIMKYGKKIKISGSHKLEGDLRTAFDFGLVSGSFRMASNNAPKFIGRVGDFHVYKGKMRNLKTWRVGTGYKFLTIPDDIWAEEVGTGRFNLRGNLSDYTYKEAYGDDGLYSLMAFHEFGRNGGMNSAYLDSSKRREEMVSTDLSKLKLEHIQECYDWLKANYGK